MDDSDDTDEPGDPDEADETGRTGDSGGADETEGLTYAETGVDIEASEAATAALVGAVGEFEGDCPTVAASGPGHQCRSFR